MKYRSRKRIPYGVSNYAEMVRENCYFIDKTEYIEKLSQVKNVIFLRPKRFGKSLFCSMLGHYYDLRHAERFDELFGHTWIGQHPTGEQNQFIILSLDFSPFNVDETYEDIRQSFRARCNETLSLLRTQYAPLLDDMPKMVLDGNVSDNLARLLYYLEAAGLPRLYVIIDEYDNFANQLITGHKDQLYNKLTADGGFFKTFFKTLKEGRKIGAIENVFITGILPVTIDELASAFNIGTFLTLDPEFENMLGFTQGEVDQLLDDVYHDYQILAATRQGVQTLIKNHYNGYRFVNPNGDALYNSTILMHFLRWFTRHKTIPQQLTDQNLKNELSWVRRLTAENPQKTEAFVDQLTLHNQIGYEYNLLTEKFDMNQFFKETYFPISFFYLGMLTKKDEFQFKLPNLNMRQIFVEYFNEIHQVNVSTDYVSIMQRFINRPNLEELFSSYWEEYILKLPEAIFMKVNENFYRTTFFELCSRYLSRWFTWNVERSYPSGKSDLEFVGKHHEKFAGLRWVIEFKYYSNTEFKKRGTRIEAFELIDSDKEQIAGYVKGLKKEYPEAQISQFVIYCFGNQGFRVFALD